MSVFVSSTEVSPVVARAKRSCVDSGGQMRRQSSKVHGAFRECNVEKKDEYLQHAILPPLRESPSRSCALENHSLKNGALPPTHIFAGKVFYAI